MADSLVFLKSKQFAVRIVKLHNYLKNHCRETVISKQLLRSGTSIGANLSEALYGFSRKEFVFKSQIALKECHETIYWLELLHDTETIDDKMFESIVSDCNEILAMLISVVKTSKTTSSESTTFS